jgi:hypothetical protein
MLGLAEYILAANSFSSMERAEACFHRTVMVLLKVVVNFAVGKYQVLTVLKL